jgi:hypothetical protein
MIDWAIDGFNLLATAARRVVVVVVAWLGRLDISRCSAVKGGTTRRGRVLIQWQIQIKLVRNAIRAEP